MTALASTAGAPPLLRRALKPCVSILCLVLLTRHFDPRLVVDALLRSNAAIVAAAAFGFLLLSLAQTWRWQLILRRLGLGGFSTRVALESVLIGMFFNQGLPSSMGGDLVRVWRLTHDRTTLKDVFSSIVIEKLAAVAAMILISLFSLPWLLRIVTGRHALLAIAAANLLAAAGLAVLLVLDKLPLVRHVAAFRLGRAVLGVCANLRKVAFSPAFLPVLAWSLAIHVAVSLLFWALTTALHLDVDPSVCIMFIPIVMLVTTIPISIAGWGIRESAVVVLFGFAGVSSAQAIAVSLLFGIAVALAALPGGLVWLLTEKPPKEILEDDPE